MAHIETKPPKPSMLENKILNVANKLIKLRNLTEPPHSSLRQKKIYIGKEKKHCEFPMTTLLQDIQLK